MKLNVLQALLAVCLAQNVPVFAYTLLDPEEIRDTRPLWTPNSADVSRTESKILSTIHVRTMTTADVFFANTSNDDVHFDFSIEHFQNPKDFPNARVSLKTGERSVVRVKVRHADHRLWQARLFIWNLATGAAANPQEVAPAPASQDFPPPGIKPPEVSFFACPSQDDTRFNPRALPYFIIQKDATNAELHFRNLGQRTFSFDFRMLGYQDEGFIAPRITLAPREDIELTVPVKRADVHLPYAIIEVFNIRFGADTGPVLIEPSKGELGSRMFRPHDMSFIAVDGDPADFNTWSVTQTPLRDPLKVTAIRFRNNGNQPIFFDFLVPPQLKATSGNQRIALQPGEQIDAPAEVMLSKNQRAIYTMVSNVRIGEDRGNYAGEAADEAYPVMKVDGLLAVTPIAPTQPAFHPKSIQYSIKPVDGKAEVTLQNMSAKNLFFNFSIASYQNEKTENARVGLRPGEIKKVTVPVLKSDIRLAIAKVKVYNIRTTPADEGPLLAERKTEN